MGSSNGEKAPSGEKKKAPLAGSLQKLRKRRIIETLAAFIGGGWLLVEVVERLLVGHYKFPEETIDLTVVSVISALVSTLVWRWFRGTEKRSGNIKVEVLLVPLIIVATMAIDLNLVLQIIDIPRNALLIGIVALCLGIAWTILKLSQWAAASPSSSPGHIQKPTESPTSVSAVPEKSIAVLPFTDLSPQKDQEYFCDGMTEEIITDLSRVRELLVISRSSAMTFKGSAKTVREIAKDLNVRYLMEGSVRKAGNGLRIAAQLIDAATDAHIWADKYSGTLDDIFDIQEKVSRSILEALKLKLTLQEDRAVAEKPIYNGAAYECYLRAKHECMQFSAEALERALKELQYGLDIIGDNALLFAGLGFVHVQMVNMGIGQQDHLDEARRYVERAFSIDRESAEANFVLGLVLILEGNGKEGVKHLKLSLAKNPGDAEIALWLAWAYPLNGKIEAGRSVVEKYRRRDPINPMWRISDGLISFVSGRYDLAVEGMQRGYSVLSDMPMVQFWYALCLAYAGRLQEGASVLAASISAPPTEDAWINLGKSLNFVLQHNLQGLSGLLTPAVLSSMKRDCQYSYHMASFYGYLGEQNLALDWLENSVNRGMVNYPLFAEYDAFLVSVRSEPRFKKLMERVKYEWEHFEV